MNTTTTKTAIAIDLNQLRGHMREFIDERAPDSSSVTEYGRWEAGMSETTNYIDPVCLMHGAPWSANPPHWAGKCLICALCFKVLNSTADCNSLPDGSYEDVCVECATEEAALNVAQTIARGEPNESEHHA